MFYNFIYYNQIEEQGLFYCAAPGVGPVPVLHSFMLEYGYELVITVVKMTSTQVNSDLKDNMDDSESVNSDESEEAIEVDEDEYDRRRATIQSDMKELEMLFTKLKEALISEKQILIDQKLKEIEEETAEEFTVPFQKLKQNMEVRINLAELLKDFKCKNIEHTYQYEEISIKKSLENDKQNVYDKYVSRLENEIREIEEKRRNFLLDYNLLELSMKDSFGDQPYENIKLEVDVNFHDYSDKKNLNNGSNSIDNNNEQHSPEEPTKKTKKSKKSPKTTHNNSNRSSSSPVVFHGSPFIVYSLQDYDILEDWSIIKMHTNINKLTSK
ncbi:unnamed protein product [Brachionus calyciflorus]|uniref:Uncharacterized protein n=1 Tax=Brachionus calyciflorus TaxID=104777 RepID=A0A813WES1_9BILA|nr:unnamed protein product [Brachionus calyciflorus]